MSERTKPASELFSLPIRFSSHLHFAPDGSSLAVLPGGGDSKAIEVYSVPDGARVATLPLTAGYSFWGDKMLRHLGDAVVHVETWESSGPQNRDRWWRLVRHHIVDGAREVLLDGIEGHALQVGSVAGGFVVTSGDRFWFGTGEGSLRQHTIPTIAPTEQTYLLASDHASERVMISHGWGKRIALLDDRAELIEDLPLAHEDGWFVDTTTVITFKSRTLSSWRMLEGGLVEQGSDYLMKEHVQFAPHSRPLGVTVLRTRGLLAYAIEYEPPHGYDVNTMKRAALPGLLAKEFPVWISNDERYGVFVDYGGMNVHDLALAMEG